MPRISGFCFPALSQEPALSCPEFLGCVSALSCPEVLDSVSQDSTLSCPAFLGSIFPVDSWIPRIGSRLKGSYIPRNTKFIELTKRWLLDSQISEDDVPSFPDYQLCAGFLVPRIRWFSHNAMLISTQRQSSQSILWIPINVGLANKNLLPRN